jgi:hypothetical protein
MKEVTIYRFSVWREGRWVLSPQLGTRQAIRAARGEADLESARPVLESEVDEAGLYTGTPPPP